MTKMMRGVRRRGLSGQVMMLTAIFVIGAYCASVAWACVPQARLVTLQPSSSGPPGADVTVEVVGFDPGPAEVRWNSFNGVLLATGDGPNFSVSVTVPQAGDGLYSVVVIARQPGGGIGNASSTPFQVVTSSGGSSDRVTGSKAVEGPRSVGSARADTSVLSLSVAFLFGGGLVALGVLGGIVLSGRRLP